MSIKHLLQETYTRTKKLTGIDARTGGGFKQTLSDPQAFSIYAKSLCEGLVGQDADDFMALSEATRIGLMENSMFQLNPYETLTMPVLRVFYPKLIARELVNVMPIDKPDVIKAFVRASFKRNYPGGDAGYDQSFPSVNTDISRGPGVGIDVEATANAGTTNILSEAGLTSANSHIEHDVVITKVTDSTGFSNVTITPTVDGTFSETVEVPGGTDVISGHFDYLNGTVTWSSAQGLVTEISYQAHCSLEENQINPTVKFDVEKIRFITKDRRISAEWTINMEQDVKALFDLDAQSEMVNIIGEQIALDIDREIIGSLIATNSALNPASHRKTFYKTPPAAFTWGNKQWYENVIPVLNDLSAQVYTSSLMGAANVLAANPLDAAIFESLNTFEYVGNSVDGGEVGYRSATVAGGKWKILVSSNVPKGTIIAKYRSSDLARAAYVYAPYVPAILTPYPLGANPSLTILSRYSTKVIRNEALATLTINEGAAP